MDQFMDREAGEVAIGDAYEALGRACVALKEQEEGSMGYRDNLNGCVSQMLGGMMDTLAAVRDVLTEGVTADPNVDTGEDLDFGDGGEDDSHDGAGVI